jgi:hypothetical protein
LTDFKKPKFTDVLKKKAVPISRVKKVLLLALKSEDFDDCNV